jgi:hypothetical protein
VIIVEFMAIEVIRERERALNWIRMEFMAINVTREKELVLKVIMMDFCG